MPQTSPYPGTRAVRRALHLLRAFSDERAAWPLSELARAAGLNKTTAFRLLSVLQSEAMVVRDPGTGAYRLGSEAIALGGRALRANELRTVARPELEEIARQTREAVTLEVLSDGAMLVLDEIQAVYVVGTSPSIGTRWPLHATSTGRALLAHLTDRERQPLLRPPLAKFTPRTITRLSSLKRELERALIQGYALVIDELELGYVAIGAPALGHDGRPAGAISLGGPASRLTRARIPKLARVVRRAAERISSDLGFRPGMAESDEAAEG